MEFLLIFRFLGAMAGDISTLSYQPPFAFPKLKEIPALAGTRSIPLSGPIFLLETVNNLLVFSVADFWFLSNFRFECVRYRHLDTITVSLNVCFWLEATFP